jgi:hypothetical protein
VILSSIVVFQKPFGGRFYDGFHAAALRFQRLAQQRLEVGRHAAQQRDGEFRRITVQVAGRKVAERPEYQLPDLRAVDMRAYERCERKLSGTEKPAEL